MLKRDERGRIILSPNNPYREELDAYARKLDAMSNLEFARYAREHFHINIIPLPETSANTGAGGFKDTHI